MKAAAEQMRNNEQVRENVRQLAELATQAARNVQAMQDALKGGAK